MKKFIAIILSFLFIVTLIGCDRQNLKGQDKSLLTLDKVVELSAKGNELTWSDFEQYKSNDVGSGLYVFVYEIDETFDLWIGGTSLEEKPFYIRLLTKANTDNFIDIRTDNVNEFIKLNNQ